MHYSMILTSPLEVGVEVDFDDTIGDGLSKLLIISLEN